jgi:hypothetical protein
MKKIRIYTFKEKQELYDHISVIGTLESHSIMLVKGEWKRERVRTEGDFKVDKLTIDKFAIVEDIAEEKEDIEYEVYIKEGFLLSDLLEKLNKADK